MAASFPYFDRDADDSARIRLRFTAEEADLIEDAAHKLGVPDGRLPVFLRSLIAEGCRRITSGVRSPFVESLEQKIREGKLSEE